MKKIYAVLTLLIVFVFTSCEDEKTSVTEIKGESGISFDQSINRWDELKANNGNSYVYTLKFTSWTGLQSSTTLTVEEGLVAQRAYQKYSIQYPEQDTTFIASYVETGDDLGSNDQGTPLFTIDDLYETCAAEYLQVDETLNTLYFNTDPSGIMNLCGYVPSNCEDDCYVGVTIDSFNWINNED